eukprot:TRINITY_DN1040_c0_g2_i1.p1 TRINITY_DN1040_c0_g2~~TRINITY_DN1040_c0_g2_i1.p1  ORF type:complete len:598 (+),score=145.93 TRINITY_DN1040_c0_g2_i1:96-1796(+)
MREMKTPFFLLCVFAIVSVALSERVPFEEDVFPISLPSEWDSLASCPAFYPVPIHIAIKQSNTRMLHDLVMNVSTPASPSYGKYLSHREVGDLFMPSVEHIRNVEAWIYSLCKENTCVWSKNREFVTLVLAAKDVEELLDTELTMHVHESGVMVGCYALNGYSVPDFVASAIDFVAGVTPRNIHPRRIHRQLRMAAGLKSNVDAKKVTPTIIRKRYNVPDDSGPVVSENLQAVVSFLGQYFSPKDLSQFYETYGAKGEGIEKIIGPNDATVPGMEASLDVQYLTGVANNVRTWVWSTGGKHEGQEPFMVWLQNVSSTENIPYLFSISYQDYEPSVSADYARRVDQEFQKLALRGVTLFTGSGDWGVGCEAPNPTCKRFAADFPSSSPHMTSVGATYIENTSEEKEVGIYFSSGGFSEIFDQPDYQRDAVSQFLKRTKTPTVYFNQSGRGFPDVGAVGEGFQVILHGQESEVGGTSASTPTFGAIVSLLNNERLKKGMPPMGFVNPFLYAAWAKNPNAYTDITEGNNKDGCCDYGFDCVEGWDPMTGLGTPNYEVLLEFALNPTKLI